MSFQLSSFTHWYESLTKESLADISKFYDRNVYFKDPFNEFRSLDKLGLIFSDMFLNLDNPHFVFIDTISDSDQIFITWDFIFKLKGKEFKIHGSSHLKVNQSHLVFYHRDYWDVGEELLLKLPLIKSLYSILRNKLSHQ